jgi:hypothetical protein
MFFFVVQFTTLSIAEDVQRRMADELEMDRMEGSVAQSKS